MLNVKADSAVWVRADAALSTLLAETVCIPTLGSTPDYSFKNCGVMPAVPSTALRPGEPFPLLGGRALTGAGELLLPTAECLALSALLRLCHAPHLSALGGAMGAGMSSFESPATSPRDLQCNCNFKSPVTSPRDLPCNYSFKSPATSPAIIVLNSLRPPIYLYIFTSTEYVHSRYIPSDVDATRGGAGRRLVLLVGASGAGKRSVLRLHAASEARRAHE
ncbi:hypothetical protein T492DRAFT_839020 [Pavlovales sp. CCMP2436]|nr:hypothetical protein T492DRAFT_839020 [Pavlovales sp. CCMP2436]